MIAAVVLLLTVHGDGFSSVEHRFESDKPIVQGCVVDAWYCPQNYNRLFWGIGKGDSDGAQGKAR